MKIIYERIRDRLEEFRGICDGWFNGHGYRIPDEMIDKFSAFMKNLLQCPSFINNFLPSDGNVYTYAMPDPGIQLEWDLNNFGVELTYSADPLDKISLYPEEYVQLSLYNRENFEDDYRLIIDVNKIDINGLESTIDHFCDLFGHNIK
jgi:hypothetical protein